jgi:membrane fusion protein, heavy metal efflux system
MSKSRLNTATLLIIGTVGLGVFYLGSVQRGRADASKVTDQTSEIVPGDRPLISLADHTPNTIRLTTAGMNIVGIRTVEVKPAPPPEPLRMPGSLLLDPNGLVRIHARFPGELVSVGTVPVNLAPTSNPGLELRRQLRFGDRVEQGHIIAVVWSKDIGEKKSELVDAISKTAIDKTLLSKLEKVEKGVVPERTIQDARRNYEADLIAVAKAERTLRSWRLTEDELEEIRQEAARIHNREINDPAADRTWAETEVRSPITGVIVEKNFNVGDIIDPSQDLFKIADLSRVQVLANAYEEDLPLLRSLRPDQRTWKIDIKSDPNDVPVSGKFETIGNIIDPAQHAGAVMGWLDNPDGRFNVGQFITATVELPANPDLVVVPTAALIEDGTCPKVFVETNSVNHEFTCRRVDVVRRGRERAYVRSQPPATDTACGGAAELRAGDHVVNSGVLELASELKSLQAAAREH